MNKKTQAVALLLLISIFVSIITNLCTYNVKAVTQSTSTDIEKVDSVKYPEIKEKIESLKKEHPNWNFKILYTGIDWEEAITNEYTGHGSSPKNLVPDSSSYKGDWICSYCGNKSYDSGNWKCASISAIKYMMDPRASLNSNDIFQFLELSYGGDSAYSRDVVKQMVQGSFLDNDSYIDTIITSCKTNNVNPYYIVARIIQEQGKEGSTLVKGKGYNGEYEGYYNVFNIGASGSGTANVLKNGFKTAQKYGWTSMELALDGGIKIISTSYIAVGQNTLYLQKFDVDNSDGKLYWHQYMQNILAAQTEGTTLRKTLNDINAIESGYTFIIPVYENMPKETTGRPSTTGFTDQKDVELVRINVTGSINIRNEPRKNAKVIGSLYSGEIAIRLEKAGEKVDGTYWDKILKNDGTTGYVARCTYDNESTYKEYLVHVSGGEADTGSQGQDNNSDDKDKKKGDVNGDGQITTRDAQYIQEHVVGERNLNKEIETLADVNGDGQITTRDAQYIQEFVVGERKF